MAGRDPLPDEQRRPVRRKARNVRLAAEARAAAVVRDLGGRRAAVTGIRQNAAFRTNVGFAAGTDGAQYTLTLQDAAGATVATTSASLGVFGWTQPGIQDLFPAVTIPENATLAVKVTAGSVDVFDSSIDNLSGDPVVTPIAPLPATILSSAIIGPAGGSIRSDDGRLTLRVPAGALASPASLSFQTTTNDAPQGTGAGYALSPPGITFATPALLTLAYANTDTESSSAEALALVSRTATGWRVSATGRLTRSPHAAQFPLLGVAGCETQPARVSAGWPGHDRIVELEGRAGRKQASRRPDQFQRRCRPVDKACGLRHGTLSTVRLTWMRPGL